MKNSYVLLILCFILNTTLLYGQTISNDGLIAHHTFEPPEQGSSQFLDQSGNGNSVFFDPNAFCPPELDRNLNPSSLSVGTSCYLSINDDYNSSSFENLSKFSCSFWVMNPSFPPVTHAGPVIQFADENKISYEVRIDENHKVILQSKNDQLLLGKLISSFSFPIGWVNITFSIDQENQTLRLYINGQLKNEDNLFLFQMGNPKILFGRDIESGTAGSALCYDDVFVFNRILEAHEVEALYNNATPISTSLENVFLDKNQVNIFPNPTRNNEITIDTNGLNESFDLTIFDSQGRIVKRFNNFSNNTLTTENLNQGLYTLLFSFDKFNVSKRLTVFKD